MSLEGVQGFLEIPNASLKVSGNVHADGLKLGAVELIPSYDLASVSNVGNTTTQTVQFTNPTTSLVASSNIMMLNTANALQQVTMSVGENAVPYTKQSLKIFEDSALGVTQASNYYLGKAVTVSADGTIVASVATHDNNPAGDNGSVLFWKKNTLGEWYVYQINRDATNLSPSGHLGNWNGSTMSMSRDGSTLVIGSPYSDAVGTNRGRAYVYTQTAGVWNLVKELYASDAADSDFFGSGTSISSDGSVIVVGAERNHANGQADQGAAYIYHKSGGTWPSTQSQKITMAENDADSYFGISVALSDDGYTLVVGSSHHDNVATNEGALFIFERGSGTWTQTKKMWASDFATGGDMLLGHSVAISGDGTIIVAGAYGNDTTGSNRGAVYIYVKSGGVWPTTETQLLRDNDANNEDYFGWHVSMSQSGDRIIVGAERDHHPNMAGAGVDGGSIVVFDRINGVWNQTKKFFGGGSNGASSELGFSTACSNDGNVYVGGAPMSEVQGGDAGHIIIYEENVWKERTKTLNVDAALIAQNPVFFSATCSAYHLNGGQVIPWDMVLMNRGAGYDPNTGVFTAPIAGYYFFIYSTMGINTASPLMLTFRKNQVNSGKFHGSYSDPTGSGDSQYNHQANSIIVDLEVGDTLDVWLTQGDLHEYYMKYNGFYLSS
jgi:hypothetical protein